METEDLDKILSKSYAELDASEREAIQEICSSEEEFTQLQQFFASVENYAQETREEHFPAPEVKSRLDDLFHETYQNKGILWYNSMWTALYPTEKRFDQRPLVRIAAILVVLISVVPLLNRPTTEKPALAQNSKPAEKEKATVSEDKKAEVPAPESVENYRLEKSQPASNTDQYTVYLWNGAAEDVSATAYEDIPRKDFSFGETTISATGATSLAFSSNANATSPAAATYKWTHPDGIYMDTFTYDQQTFAVNQNLAVLDLLTPTF